MRTARLLMLGLVWTWAVFGLGIPLVIATVTGTDKVLMHLNTFNEQIPEAVLGSIMILGGTWLFGWRIREWWRETIR